MLCSNWQKLDKLDLTKAEKVVNKAIDKISALQSKDNITRLNTVLTDGKQLLATRYISDTTEQPLTLYYSIGDSIAVHDNKTGLMHAQKGKHNAIIIASEPLADYSKAWNEVPLNHLLLVDADLNIKITPLDE